jgi:hypothetical protein
MIGAEYLIQFALQKAYNNNPLFWIVIIQLTTSHFLTSQDLSHEIVDLKRL